MGSAGGGCAGGCRDVGLGCRDVGLGVREGCGGEGGGGVGRSFPVRGFLPPTSFLPALEHGGLRGRWSRGRDAQRRGRDAQRQGRDAKRRGRNAQRQGLVGEGLAGDRERLRQGKERGQRRLAHHRGQGEELPWRPLWHRCRAADGGGSSCVSGGQGSNQGGGS